MIMPERLRAAHARGLERVARSGESRLAGKTLQMEGLRKDGTTALKSKLRILGGNAAFTGATGKGSFTGARAAELGSPIVIKVTVKVHGISN